ncbi:MAG: type II secretion system F family protein, partial [Planctomycetota bacterium]
GRGQATAMMLTTYATGTMLVTVTAFLLKYIVPKMAAIFSGFGVELPGLTASFFGLAEFFSSIWHFLVLPASGLSCWGLWYAWRDARHRLRHGCPLYAHAWPRYWVPGLLRMFSTSIAAGEPFLPCMQAAVQQLPAGRASERMLELRELLEQGESVPAAFRRTRLLSRRDAAFLESALTAGHPDWAMRQLADLLDGRRVRRTQRRQFLTACGLQATVSFFVLWFVLAFFMPLIKLVNDLS